MTPKHNNINDETKYLNCNNNDDTIDTFVGTALQQGPAKIIATTGQTHD